jgi:4-amino-4-deoxy-L-arabinose transferase-like glycosyltransferase
MSDRTRLLVLQIAVIVSVCAFLFFFGLGAFGLVGADEPRYAQIAREMFQRHDWIVPTLNDTPWLEKPPLLYWKVINSYRIFGVSDWAARVPAAAHAVALVLAVFFFMRRFRPGSEGSVVLITASSAAIIGFARGASTDMLLAVHFSVAMLAWWTWRQNGKAIWLACFYAFLAFGTLAKGPVAPALAVLVVGAYAWLRRDGSILWRSLSWPGLALFLVIVLPWYVAVQMRVPQFFRVFFIEHNLERFGTNLYQHAQPFWYYLPVFLLSTLPWTSFTVPALVDAIRGEIKKGRRNEDETVPAVAADREAGQDRLSLFLLLWILVPIVFFSISRAKLPGYILPAIPAAALLTADYLNRRRAVSRLQLMLHSLLCAMVLCGALLVPWVMLKEPVPQTTRNIIVVSAGVVAVMVLLAVRRGGLRALYFVTLVPVSLALAFLLRMAAIPSGNVSAAGGPRPISGLILDLTQSARPVDQELRRLGVKDGTPVAVFQVRRDLAYGLDFYRKQPISYYENEGPLDMPHGIPAEEHVVVTRAGNGDAVEAAASPRAVKRLGAFPPRQLEFFLVSSAR